MSTSANLAAGQFITSIGGKRCTAVPKGGVNIAAVVTTSSTSTETSTSTSISVLVSTSTSTSTTESTSTTALASSSSTAIVAATSSPVNSPSPSALPASTPLPSSPPAPSLSALPPLSSLSNPPLPVPSSTPETNIAQAPQAQGTNDSLPISAPAIVAPAPAVAASPLPVSLSPLPASASPAASASASPNAAPAPNVAPVPQAQAQSIAQPVAQTTTSPSSSVIVQASQADTGIIASLSTAAVTAATAAAPAAVNSAPAEAVPAVAASSATAADAGVDTATDTSTVTDAATRAANGVAASVVAGTDTDATSAAAATSTAAAATSAAASTAAAASAAVSVSAAASLAAGASLATSAPLVLTTATFSSSSISNGNGAAVLSTIAAPTAGTTNDASTAETSSSSSSSSSSTPGTSPAKTIAIAGGVIGGLAFLALLMFLFWFWQRRMKKKRRSTLLTPLSNVPAQFREDSSGNERGQGGSEYVINRGSIGPTPKAVRIKASLGYSIQRIKEQLNKMMAGGAGAAALNINNASETTAARNIGRGGTIKAKGLSFFGVGKNDYNEKYVNNATTANNNPGQPDFLTLLGMDERELERAAQNKKNYQKKRASRGNSRSSLMGGMNSQGGSNSNNDYLGRLNINFDNPFSDANTVGGGAAKYNDSVVGAASSVGGVSHPSAKPAPLMVSQENNPFADTNAIASTANPGNYVADIRRSRGQSISSAYGDRESVQTVATVDAQAKRNRFRSDPFDLERPELLGRSTPAPSLPKNTRYSNVSDKSRDSRLSGGVGTGEIRRPRGSHQRTESFTSKYSSGVSGLSGAGSMSEWSDPGPDVGPSQSFANKRLQRTNSGNSNQSVGKAL